MHYLVKQNLMICSPQYIEIVFLVHMFIVMLKEIYICIFLFLFLHTLLAKFKGIVQRDFRPEVIFIIEPTVPGPMTNWLFLILVKILLSVKF